MKNKPKYGSSVISTENRACIEIADLVKGVVKSDEVYVVWCNDWIIIEGETADDCKLGELTDTIFGYLKQELGYTEKDCKTITIYNKLVFLNNGRRWKLIR